MKDEEVKEHESYGMLRIARVTGGERNLFGSSISHSSTIKIEISKAEEKRHLNQFWYHSKKNIIEIEMSPTQFTEAITNMNTSGVPVTIKYVDGKRIEGPPYEKIFDKFNTEIKDDISKVFSNTCKLMKSVETKLKRKGNISKAERLEIAGLLYKIEQDIRLNLPFINKQFCRQVSKTITEAKGSIEAFFVNTIHKLGSDKLKQKLEDDNIVPPTITIERKQKIKRLKK
jgi:hypothetical protein